MTSHPVSVHIVPPHFIDKLAISADFLSTRDICQLSQSFNTWLKDVFIDNDINDLLSARAVFVDAILKKLWCQHHLDEFQITLIAVGGYGRGELHPQSDVDILLLTQEEVDLELEEKISSFITQLWDIKLDIGHSVRSIKECLKQAVNEVTVATNLMEMRQITGNETLTQQLTPLLSEDVFWTSEKFFIAKCKEQEDRHQQYRGAAYTLEPNLKANPGGLRDIQTIAWVAKRHFSADSLEELVEHNYLYPNEFFELLESQDYLWRMRFALHFVAGRSENRLLFDYQADVAKMMGFGDEGKAPVERMMKRFFRIIARVTELNTMLLQHFEQAIIKKPELSSISIINQDFELVDKLINTRNDRIFMRPVKMIEMFLIIAQEPGIKGIHSHTMRLLRNARRRLISGLIDYAECRRMFMAIIRHPRGLGLALTLMHRHSIISSYLPLWRNIAGQMQFDLFHAYSVDEHSYRVIKNLHQFSQKEHNHKFPLCSKIVQKIRKPEVLYLAGFFHDIGKGRGGDHAKLGAVDALTFCMSHQLSKHDSNMVAWLVEHHLLMSVTAQRRDINDENVIRTFGEIVRDEAHLNYLYCLTVADMRGTNESLWNNWKANLLEELYFNTLSAFRHGLEKPVEVRSKIRENQQQALSLLSKNNVNEQSIKALWREFRIDYFLRYSPEQIARQCENIIEHNREKPLVLISPIPYRGGTEVFIFTKEKNNTFANTVSFLVTKKLSIHDAKIITTKTGYTVNTFVVLDSRNKPLRERFYTKEMSQTLVDRLQQIDICDLPEPKLARHMKKFKVPLRVNFIKIHAKNRTMIEIIALDRPGLLSNISQVFLEAKVNIHSAKITTFGEKADDVFTISTEKDDALTNEEQEALALRLTQEID
ncbi:[protein-PII] uridylyltransferase [Colwellia psychrerythraea]|uniref:Bifunctional uridylyltransferase/uridylyl-removing enzyme n=1 Tax=Colwellia psychrerythraea TaxID=28229 RepID=A0A099KNW2_COLPS|nr:[protein-PII] uridylyltransferase [Colwellia psychrerythraea]KGJ91338.1 UTP-GlnB uridylyltransferase, GlnD / adenyl transferase, GlnE [Colwellia psychrerythraea]